MSACGEPISSAEQSMFLSATLWKELWKKAKRRFMLMFPFPRILMALPLSPKSGASLTLLGGTLTRWITTPTVSLPRSKHQNTPPFWWGASFCYLMYNYIILLCYLFRIMYLDTCRYHHPSRLYHTKFSLF